MFRLNRKFSISVVTSILSSIGILHFQNNHLKYLSNQNDVDYKQQEQQLKAEAKFYQQIPSFGFSNLISDLVFLKYIQYFGDTEAREKTGYSIITEYFETIVDKDPKFIQANLSLSASNSIFAGKPEKTVALLETSAKSLTPDMQGYPFMIFAYKAVDEILFLGDLVAAQKSYSKAADWAKARNDEVGNKLAQLYRNTIKFLATNPDSSHTQVSGWSMVLKRNNDPKIQKYAIQKIEELGGEVVISADGEITVKPPKKDV